MRHVRKKPINESFPKTCDNPFLWGMKKFVYHPKMIKLFDALESPKNVNP